MTDRDQPSGGKYGPRSPDAPGGKPRVARGAKAGARPPAKTGGKPGGDAPRSDKRRSAKRAEEDRAADRRGGERRSAGPPRKSAAPGARKSAASSASSATAPADSTASAAPAARKGPPRGGPGGRPSRPGRPSGPPAIPGAGGVGGTVKAEAEGPMRVQRALARAGVVSRREADRAVADGRVTINGTVALIGQTVDPHTDKIALDGNPVRLAMDTHRWIVLHKPAATMTTRKDPGGRRTVFDLVKDVPGLVYVGRLDFMTEGVLLLTTDGRAAHALTHPSNEVERTYVATVKGDAGGAVRAARRGVQLEDGLVIPRAVSASALGNGRWYFEITIAEGRTHEVRRLCDALGLEVERLVRTQFGPVRLGTLGTGETRALTPVERDILDALVPAR